MGGDERVAVHHLITALADRPAALAMLHTLLVAVGRTEAAAIVARSVGTAPRKG